MEREAHKARSFEEAEQWNLRQQWAMTPDERITIACALRDRFYGTGCADVREVEKQKSTAESRRSLSPQDGNRRKDPDDDLDHLPPG